MRKVLHMQKCYPETVFRLNRQGRKLKPDADRPISSRWHRNPAPNNYNTSVAAQQQRHRRPQSSLQAGRSADSGHEQCGNTARRRGGYEYRFCRDKMAYNRTKGRCAVGFRSLLHSLRSKTNVEKCHELWITGRRR